MAITNGWVLLLTNIDSQSTTVIGPFESYEDAEVFYYSKVREEVQNTFHVQIAVVESQADMHAAWRRV